MRRTRYKPRGRYLVTTVEGEKTRFSSKAAAMRYYRKMESIKHIKNGKVVHTKVEAI